MTVTSCQNYATGRRKTALFRKAGKMALWVVRAGRHGEQEETARNESVVCHAWNELPDYSSYATKDDLRSLYKQTFPAESDNQVRSGLGQVWRFAHDIQIGDLAALPLKHESAFLFGQVTGEYEYKVLAPNVKHIRRVKWLKSVPRSAFAKDVLFTFNSLLTVFRADRAEKAARAILDMPDALSGKPAKPIIEPPDDEQEEDTVNLEDTARDEILKFIESNFKGHSLARLVNAILIAQGYKTEMSSPGPDGGVDILAGSGALGFAPPRLCVQVKSGGGAVSQGTYNELMGVVSKFDSEQGLMVSWSGFTNAVTKDARKSFFKIRLWDQGDIVNAVLQHYDQLDDDIKAELPLKRIWVMVNDDLE